MTSETAPFNDVREAIAVFREIHFSRAPIGSNRSGNGPRGTGRTLNIKWWARLIDETCAQDSLKTPRATDARFEMTYSFHRGLIRRRLRRAFPCRRTSPKVSISSKRVGAGQTSFRMGRRT